jgi:hypothetical protein
LNVKDVHDYAGKSPKRKARATKAVLSQNGCEFCLQVKLESRCHSGLANVPPFSCGRISKDNLAGSPDQPVVLTTGDSDAVTVATTRGHLLQRLVSQPAVAPLP